MTTDRTAVLLMAYGTPRTPAEIEPYYTDIRRGRAPTPELLAELVARYDAIGGISPLAARTEAQRDALQSALDAQRPGEFVVSLGLKHADPKIEDAVEEVAKAGFHRIVGLVLAPHYSSYSIGQYLDRTRAAAEPHGIEVIGIDSWATEPAFVEFLARDISTRLAAMPARTGLVVVVGHRLAVGGTHARTVDRSGHSRGHRRPGSERVGLRSAGVRLRLRRRPPGSPLRLGHRSPGLRRGTTPGIRPHSLRQRRSDDHGGAGPTSGRGHRAVRSDLICPVAPPGSSSSAAESPD